MRFYWKIAIWVGYLVLVAVVKFPHQWPWWLMGMGLGLGLLLADRLLYVWWLKPFEQLSIQVQYWWRRYDWKGVGRLLLTRGKEQTKLLFKSVVFAFIWPFLAVFIITSTGSVTAVGMMMGIGLSLAIALVEDWHDPKQLSKWWGWQIKRELSNQEVRFMAGIYLGLWAFFNVLVVL